VGYDALAALEGPRPNTDNTGELERAQKTIEALMSSLDDTEEQVGVLEEKVADLTMEVEALKAKPGILKRATAGLSEGRATRRAEKAEAEAERLRTKLDDQKEADEIKYLPAVAKAETQIAVVEQKHGQEMFALGQVLAQKDELLVETRGVCEALEFQRDERDDMLRKEEARRQQAELSAQQTGHALAMVRTKFLLENDPGLSEERAERTKAQLAKTRVLAWLGNMMAQAELGVLHDVCPLCGASPRCLVHDVPVFPHGGLIPLPIQTYLAMLISEAKDKGADPKVVLEGWASGVEISKLDFRSKPDPEEDEDDEEDVDDPDTECGRDEDEYWDGGPDDDVIDDPEGD